MADYKENKQKQIDLSLYNVKTITSLSYINNISDNVLNNSYAVFAYDDERDNRYVSHKVKFLDIINKSAEKSITYVDVLKDELIYFMDNLDLKTSPIYFNIEKRPIDNGFDTWTSKRTGYEFIITPQFAYISEDTSSYIISYIPPINNSEGTYTYLYSSYINPGFVNHEVLQEYINNTIERILGAPNTPERYDEAINTIQEFVNWFQGYTYNDDAGSLQHLIDTIESKDNIIKELSYNYTNETFNNIQIDGGTISDAIYNELSKYDVTYTAPIGYAITAITQTDGILSAYSYAPLGNPIEVDDNPDRITLTINGTIYTLGTNDNGALGFDQYTPISLRTSGGGTLEIDSTADSSNLLFKCSDTSGHSFTNVVWKNSDNTPADEIPTTVSSSTQITVVQNGNDTISRVCEVTDGKSSDTKTISLQFTKMKMWIFSSNNDNFNVTITNNQPDNLPATIYNTANVNIPASTKVTTTSAGYVYILMPSNWTSKRFYFGSSFDETPITKQEHIKIYSVNKDYVLYRSLNLLSSGTIVEIK